MALMVISVMAMILEMCFEGRTYIPFVLAVLASGFSLSNTISRFEIQNKTFHMIALLLLGVYGYLQESIAVSIIAVMFICIGTGLFIDKLWPTKDN